MYTIPTLARTLPVNGYGVRCGRLWFIVGTIHRQRDAKASGAAQRTQRLADVFERVKLYNRLGLCYGRVRSNDLISNA